MSEKNGTTRIPPIAKLHARELRSEATLAERKLWKFLRNKQMGGHRFRRQHPVGRYIVDIVCIERRLVVEMDGGQHAEQTEYDTERSVWLESQGFTVLRFWNNDVLNNIDGVVEKVLFALARTLLPPSQPSPLEGEGAESKKRHRSFRPGRED